MFPVSGFQFVVVGFVNRQRVTGYQELFKDGKDNFRFGIWKTTYSQTIHILSMLKLSWKPLFLTK